MHTQIRESPQYELCPEVRPPGSQKAQIKIRIISLQDDVYGWWGGFVGLFVC